MKRTKSVERMFYSREEFTAKTVEQNWNGPDEMLALKDSVNGFLLQLNCSVIFCELHPCWYVVRDKANKELWYWGNVRRHSTNAKHE